MRSVFDENVARFHALIQPEHDVAVTDFQDTAFCLAPDTWTPCPSLWKAAATVSAFYTERNSDDCIGGDYTRSLAPPQNTTLVFIFAALRDFLTALSAHWFSDDGIPDGQAPDNTGMSQEDADADNVTSSDVPEVAINDRTNENLLFDVAFYYCLLHQNPTIDQFIFETDDSGRALRDLRLADILLRAMQAGVLLKYPNRSETIHSLVLQTLMRHRADITASKGSDIAALLPISYRSVDAQTGEHDSTTLR